MFIIFLVGTCLYKYANSQYDKGPVQNIRILNFKCETKLTLQLCEIWNHQ